MNTGPTDGAVFVQTNEANNEVIAFRRAADGSLTKGDTVATGGKGDGKAHLTSQGSVITAGDGRHLLVANAGSDDVSLFAIEAGAPRLVAATSTGNAPKSIAEHAGLVYVLNTGEPSLAGLRIGRMGLEPIMGSDRRLDAGVDPAQVGFSVDGKTLIVTQRGNDAITTFPVGEGGLLGPAVTSPSAGPTPYGFAASSGGTLVVTEAFRAEKGAAAASSYRIGAMGLEPVTASSGNGRSEICWAQITPDDRFAFTTNFADGAVSRYAIAADGGLTLEDATAGLAIDGATGLRDEGLTPDGAFLYAIDADGMRIYGWSVGMDGSLTAVGSWDGVPATVAGLAAI